MAYLEDRTKFESAIKRGVTSFRSKRLDAVVAAIKGYIDGPSGDALNAIERAWGKWQAEDPKEFHNRGGLQLQPYIQQEIAEQGRRFWGSGTIRIADRLSHPEYVPQIWNHPHVRYSTNCYAYACDDPWGHQPEVRLSAREVIPTKPQPGELAGLQLREYSRVSVRSAVEADDRFRAMSQKGRLRPAFPLEDKGVPASIFNIQGHYLVALIIATDIDYHWARQDRSGYWSHKPGSAPATDLDWNGAPIRDPRTATFRVTDNGITHTYRFEAFYYCPRGGVRTQSLGSYSREPVRGKSSLY